MQDEMTVTIRLCEDRGEGAVRETQADEREGELSKCNNVVGDLRGSCPC